MSRRLWSILTPLLLAGLLAGAATAATHARIDWNLREPLLPFRLGDAHDGATRRRVLAVVIDGLGAEEAKQLPTLRKLSRQGASADLWADGPTFSSAQYVALLTGVPPIDSGIRNNSDIHLVALDSVPAEFRRQGRTAAFASDDVDWWRGLLGPAWGEGTVVAPGGVAAWVRAHAGTDFVLAHLCGVDEAGHRSGAASADYREAAREADAAVAELAKAWLKPGAVLAVTADHGHVAHGGHGGDEEAVRHTWMVLTGEGVRAGVTGAGSALDVAPTLAALGGVAAPGTAEGRTLTALLDGPTAELTRLDDERLTRVLPLAASARARNGHHEAGARGLRGALVVLLAAAALVALARGGRFALAGAGAGLVGLGATVLGQFLLWGSPSASGAPVIGLIVEHDGYLSFACSTLALFLLGRTALRGTFDDACRLAGGFAAGASPLALLTFVDSGAFVRRFTCLPSWREVAPMSAYAAWAAALLVALVPLAVAALRGLRRERAFKPEME